MRVEGERPKAASSWVTLECLHLFAKIVQTVGVPRANKSWHTLDSPLTTARHFLDPIFSRFAFAAQFSQPLRREICWTFCVNCLCASFKEIRIGNGFLIFQLSEWEHRRTKGQKSHTQFRSLDKNFIVHSGLCALAGAQHGTEVKIMSFLWIL